MAHCIPSTVEGNPHASEGNSPPTTDIRAHSWFSPSQWTRGGTAARARPSAPSTHYLLLSSPYSLLSCPFVPIRGSLLLNGRAAEPPRGRAQARHPRTTFSFLLPTPYFRAHSCPFVVLSFLCLSWFSPFVVQEPARATGELGEYRKSLGIMTFMIIIQF